MSAVKDTEVAVRSQMVRDRALHAVYHRDPELGGGGGASAVAGGATVSAAANAPAWTASSMPRTRPPPHLSDFGAVPRTAETTPMLRTRAPRRRRIAGGVVSKHESPMQFVRTPSYLAPTESSLHHVSFGSDVRLLESSSQLRQQGSRAVFEEEEEVMSRASSQGAMVRYETDGRPSQYSTKKASFSGSSAGHCCRKETAFAAPPPRMGGCALDGTPGCLDAYPRESPGLSSTSSSPGEDARAARSVGLRSAAVDPRAAAPAISAVRGAGARQKGERFCASHANPTSNDGGADSLRLYPVSTTVARDLSSSLTRIILSDEEVDDVTQSSLSVSLSPLTSGVHTCRRPPLTQRGPGSEMEVDSSCGGGPGSAIDGNAAIGSNMRVGRNDPSHSGQCNTACSLPGQQTEPAGVEGGCPTATGHARESTAASATPGVKRGMLEDAGVGGACPGASRPSKERAPCRGSSLPERGSASTSIRTATHRCGVHVRGAGPPSRVHLATSDKWGSMRRSPDRSVKHHPTGDGTHNAALQLPPPFVPPLTLGTIVAKQSRGCSKDAVLPYSVARHPNAAIFASSEATSPTRVNSTSFDIIISPTSDTVTLSDGEDEEAMMNLEDAAPTVFVTARHTGHATSSQTTGYGISAPVILSETRMIRKGREGDDRKGVPAVVVDEGRGGGEAKSSVQAGDRNTGARHRTGGVPRHHERQWSATNSNAATQQQQQHQGDAVHSGDPSSFPNAAVTSKADNTKCCVVM